MNSGLSLASLAGRFPDIPRWVEMRDLLLAEDCEILGLREHPELSVVVREPATGSIFVAGMPESEAIREAIGRNAHRGEIVAGPEQVEWLQGVLPEWIYSRAILHTLPGALNQPPASDAEIGFLDPALLDEFPIFDELLEELKFGAQYSSIAAAFVDGRPVSFCYAGAVTESLWDIAIDTLPEYQRRGYAAQCAAYMIRYMAGRGKSPVWGALVDNPASWRLAEKLGFVVVDELALFNLPEQAGSGSG